MFNKLIVSRARLPLTIVVWLGLIACVLAIAASKEGQWDFRVFYFAIHGLLGGANPYLPIHAYADKPDTLTFIYPPLTLYSFQWVSLLTLHSALLAWLGLKLVALGLLAWLWHRNFERLDVSWPVALFIALGFNAALFRDFSSGNVSTFEELGIWLGFTLLLRDRPYAAAVVLACVAQFKLLPAAFICLIPLVRPHDGWKPFLLGSALFLGLFALNPVLNPPLTHDYLEVLSNTNSSLDERGSENPSSLALLRDVMHLGANVPGLADNRTTGTLVYAAFLLALLVVLARVIWSERQKFRNADPKLLLYFGCALFAVVMPRMKDYTYILLLMPTLFVLRDIGKRSMVPDYLLLAVGLMICAQSPQTYVPRLVSLVYLLQSYLPLFIAAAVLAYVLRAILQPPPAVEAYS